MFFGDVCPLFSAFGISFNRFESENQKSKLKAIIQNTPKSNHWLKPAGIIIQNFEIHTLLNKKIQRKTS